MRIKVDDTLDASRYIARLNANSRTFLRPAGRWPKAFVFGEAVTALPTVLVSGRPLPVF